MHSTFAVYKLLLYFHIDLLAVVSIKLKVYDDKLILHVNLHWDFARFNLIRVVEKRGGLLVSGGIWHGKNYICMIHCTRQFKLDIS